LTRPIKVTIGSDDLAAGTRIKQIVEVVEDRARETKLFKLLKVQHHPDYRLSSSFEDVTAGFGERREEGKRWIILTYVVHYYAQMAAGLSKGGSRR
jgi:hypothetical protein